MCCSCKGSFTAAFYRLVYILWLINGVLGQMWMSLAMVTSDILSHHKLCDYRFWTDTQRQMCIRYRDLIPSVAVGAELAYSECKYQFQWRRWNCVAENTNVSILANPGGQFQTFFGNSLKQESREAAIVNAIFSAGVVYKIAKECSSNRLQSCSCDRSPDTDKSSEVWQPCNDNVKFGTSFAKQFIDSVELNWSVQKIYSSHAKSLMNLHNNEVGRKLISDSLWKRCSCRGPSGSCTRKLCSKQLADFRHIGDLLKRRSDKAVEVEVKYINTRSVLMPTDKTKAAVTNDQIVYLKDSPLYCNTNNKRRCKLDPDAEGSCSKLCCGKGHHTKVETRTKNCNCQFKWCCTVTCLKCEYREKVHICK